MASDRCAGIAMVHKNLRTLLYYVVGVTAVCLMIEVTDRSPVTGIRFCQTKFLWQVSKRSSGLDPALYVVETEASHNLVSPPAAPASSSIAGVVDDEVGIPTAQSQLITGLSASR